jgi:hypothetical protein
VSSVTISKAEALELAHAEVERRGLPWIEPFSVHWGIWNYSVWTKHGTRGGNVIVRVNRRSGAATVVGHILK